MEVTETTEAQEAARDEEQEEGMPDVEDLKALDRKRQRRILIDLVDRGLKDEEIGEAFGLSRWQIRNLRYKLGIKKDRSGRLALGRSGSSSSSRTKKGLEIRYEGQLQGEEAAARLAGLRTLLLAAGVRPFEVSLRFREVREVDGEAAGGPHGGAGEPPVAETG